MGGKIYKIICFISSEKPIFYWLRTNASIEREVLFMENGGCFFTEHVHINNIKLVK